MFKRILLFLISTVFFAIGPWKIRAADDIEFPAIQAFGAFSLTEPLGVDSSVWKCHFIVNHSNINLTNEDKAGTVNMEWTSLTFCARYGLNNWITLEGALRLDWAQNGFLDRIIEGFHSFWGLPDGGRDFSPRNFLEYSYKDLFRIEGEGAGPFFSGHLGFLWTPLRHKSWSFSLRSGFTVHPVDRMAYHVSGFLPFIGAMVDYQYSQGGLSLSVHWRPLKRPDWLENEPLDNKLLLVSLAGSYKIWRLSLNIKNSPYSEGRIGQGARQLYIGCRLLSWMEIGICEELFYYTTLPDVGFHLRFFF